MLYIFLELGSERAAEMVLPVINKWRPFRKSTLRNAPKARVVFDTFHVLQYRGNTLDQVRRQKYIRFNDKERTFIKGQRDILLSHKVSLDLEGRRSLRLLLKTKNGSILPMCSKSFLANYGTISTRFERGSSLRTGKPS